VTNGPAALTVVFGAAIADGINASDTAIDIAIRDLLPFMRHLFYWGDLV
jgi:hypothetical protein